MWFGVAVQLPRLFGCVAVLVFYKVFFTDIFAGIAFGLAPFSTFLSHSLFSGSVL